MIATPSPPSSASPRSAGFLLASLVVLVALVPPEVHGASLAGVGALVALAVLVAPVSREDALVAAGAAALAALAGRFAAAPGESVEPAALIVLALAAGIATSRLRPDPAFAGAACALLAALLGARAILEIVWGHAAAAADIRAGAAVADADAVLNRLEQGRAYGGFPTPAALAGFLLLILAPAAAWALSRRGALRIAGLAACAAGIAGVIATRSLTAIGAAAGVLTLAAIGRRIGGRTVVAALALLAAIALGAALARPDGVLSLGRDDSPWRLRAGNVRIALEIARANPAMGVGPGGFAEAFPAFRRPGDNESRYAHDLPAQLVAEWGIPGGLALAAAFFAVFLLPLFRGTTDWRDPAAAVALGLAAFALHNLADFTAFLPSLALAAAVLRGAIARTGESPRASRGARAALGAVALLAAVASGLSGLARDSLLGARDAAAAGDRASARTGASRAATLAPWDCDARMAAAQTLERTDPEALGHADAAVAAAPVRAAARAVRAELRAAAGDVPGARSDHSRAATLHPGRESYARRRDEIAAALDAARPAR